MFSLVSFQPISFLPVSWAGLGDLAPPPRDDLDRLLPGYVPRLSVLQICLLAVGAQQAGVAYAPRNPSPGRHLPPNA